MIKNEKKAKEREKKEMEAMNRKHLSSMRVVQKSLVYVIGLPTKLANDEVKKYVLDPTNRMAIMLRSIEPT